MKDYKPIICANCQREIYIGDEFIEVQEAVFGEYGVIPLDIKLSFCCVACIKKYFEDGHELIPKFQPRVP